MCFGLVGVPNIAKKKTRLLAKLVSLTLMLYNTYCFSCLLCYCYLNGPSKLVNDLSTYRGYFGSILGCIEVDTLPRTSWHNFCMARAWLGDMQLCVGSRFFLRILLTRFAQVVLSVLVAFLMTNCFPFCVVLWCYSFTTFLIICYGQNIKVKVFNFLVFEVFWVGLHSVFVIVRIAIFPFYLFVFLKDYINICMVAIYKPSFTGFIPVCTKFFHFIFITKRHR